MKNRNIIIGIILLVIVGILVFIALKKSKTEVVEMPIVNNSSNQMPPVNSIPPQQQPSGLGFQFCPDEKIVNYQGQVGSQYYNYQGTRYEVSQFDSVWVSVNCNVSEQKVY